MSKKHVLGYTIFTNFETKYITPKIEIQGAFVRFQPQVEVIKGKTTTLEGTEIILPENAIKEIVYQEINEGKSSPEN